MELGIIALASILVGEAEFGDKTQLAVIFTAAKIGKPLLVALMSSIALILATLIGVIIGGVISYIIPTNFITLIAAIGFIIMGLYTLFEKEEDDEESNGNKSLFSIITLVFLAEMGDKTQLIVLLLSAQTGSYFEVFIGASIGLALVTIIGVVIGQNLRQLPRKKVKIAGAVLFIAIGIIMLLESFGLIIL